MSKCQFAKKKLQAPSSLHETVHLDVDMGGTYPLPMGAFKYYENLIGGGGVSEAEITQCKHVNNLWLD